VTPPFRCRWQRFDQLQSARELLDGLDQRRSLQGSPPCLAPQGGGLFNLARFGAMTRQQLRPELDYISKLSFQRLGNTGMEDASWLSQQRSVGCILDKRMLEEVSGVRRHALLPPLPYGPLDSRR
jgi:hypothetical protein